MALIRASSGSGGGGSSANGFIICLKSTGFYIRFVNEGTAESSVDLPTTKGSVQTTVLHGITFESFLPSDGSSANTYINVIMPTSEVPSVALWNLYNKGEGVEYFNDTTSKQFKSWAYTSYVSVYLH